MASLVEGTWKNFQFKMIHPEDYPLVLEHLHANFYFSTPLTAGLTELEYPERYLDEFDQVYLKVLPQNLSFCAVDMNTNQIAGLRITFVETKKLEQELTDIEFKTRQMEIMRKIMGKVNRESRIYEQYGVEFFINFYTACVDPIYRGQGLATEMYVRALRFVKSFKAFSSAVVKSNLTSPYTRKICTKFGFTELARAYYNDFRDENGKLLLNGRKDDEFVAFMAKRLES